MWFVYLFFLYDTLKKLYMLYLYQSQVSLKLFFVTNLITFYKIENILDKI